MTTLTEKQKYALFTMRFPCHKEGEPLPEGVPRPRVTYSNIRSEKLFEERRKAMMEEVLRAAEKARNNPQPPRETPEEEKKRIAAQLECLKQDRLKELREEEQKRQRET
ncbi:MAG: hypothetical protein AAF471_06760 [Myxococcota bacterium]